MFEAVSENARIDALTNQRHAPVPFTINSLDDVRRLRQIWAKLDSIPRMLSSREEGDDHSWPGMDVRTVLTGDDSSGRQSFHDIIVQPGAGLPPHTQLDADTYWYMFSGQIEMTIGSVSEVVGKGAFAYAPQDTTQAIWNHSAEPARLLVAYFPAGADRAFSEAHDLWLSSNDANPEPYLTVLEKYGFQFNLTGPQKHDDRVNAPVDRLEYTIKTFDDFEALRDAWRLRNPIPRLMKGTGDQENLDRGTVNGHVIVGGDEDSGRAVFLQGVVDPKHSAPQHHQPAEEECFFVVEGEISLTCGTATALIGPGAFGFAPRFTTHAFNNPQDVAARVISVNSPAGHERGFEMMARQHENRTEDFPELVTAHGWVMHPQPSLQH